nr:hypothetical protein [Sinobaca sp. H24]
MPSSVDGTVKEVKVMKALQLP